MNTRAMIIIMVSILAACSEKRTITMTVDQEKFKKAMRDNNVSNLATQLESIHYPVSITHEGDTLTIRVGQTSVSDVRRAVCRQTGWSSYEGKMAQIDNTLKMLRWTGITKVKIASDTATLDVELEKDARCKKAP